MTLKVKITKIEPIINSSFEKAVVDVVINNALLVKDIRIVEANGQLSICLPEHPSPYDVGWISKRIICDQITEEIVALYKEGSRE